jgi:hypothetical protein
MPGGGREPEDRHVAVDGLVFPARTRNVSCQIPTSPESLTARLNRRHGSRCGRSLSLANREDESLTAAASARMDTPSARADASAQLRSRSACSSRHAARDTRSSTSRRHLAVRSAIFHAHSLTYVHCSAKWTRWRVR